MKKEEIISLREYELKRWGYDTCYKIYHTPNDVSYKWYKKIFDGYNWEDKS